jgi:hypothetical protein
MILLLVLPACKHINTEIPLITEIQENDLILSPSITPEVIITTENSPTVIPEQYTSLAYTVKSNNGKFIATAYTTKEYLDYNEVLNKITVQTDEGIYEYSDIIGYYDNMKWSQDDTKLAASFYGRQWGNFIIFDTINNTVINPVTDYNKVINYFEESGYVFEYEPHEFRPDPYFNLIEWSDDCNSIKIEYSVIDTEWQTQSGSFWYDLNTGELKELEQNPPFQQG